MTENAVIEATKIKEISLIADEQKEMVLKSLPLLAIPYMPITKDFIQDWILNDVEYPTFEGKVSQAVTEMRVRLNALVDHNYQYQVCELEKRELELDIEDIKNNKHISEARREVMVQRKELDLKMKNYRAQSIRQNAESTYRELVHWIHTAEDGIEAIRRKHPEIKSFEDIDFDKVRCIEMDLKLQLWQAKADQGGQLTPSQEVLVRAKALAKVKKDG